MKSYGEHIPKPDVATEPGETNRIRQATKLPAERCNATARGPFWACADWPAAQTERMRYPSPRHSPVEFEDREKESTRGDGTW